MIKWSEIESECTGFRQGLVAVFKKYEGMETDERSAQNKAVMVTINSFARHMGIAESTFKDWVRKEDGTAAARSSRAGSWTAREQEAAAQAKAEEAAAAEKRQEAALAAQAVTAEAAAKTQAEKAYREKEQALAEANRRQKAAVEAERVKAKAEAEVAAEKKLKHIEELLRAEIAAEPPTPQVLAEMAKQALTSDDPDVVNKMAEAYGQHRIEQDKRNKADASARAAAARAAKAEREAQDAEKRASKEYEDSALKMFMDAHDMLIDCAVLLGRKQITFSNVIASGCTQGEILDAVEEAVEISKRIEANVIEVTVTGDPVDVR